MKLGGSLVRSGAHEALVELIAELVTAGHDLVIVPGGGVFADAVRRESDHAATSETAAHWMATLAMDQMAYLLAGRSARNVARPHEIARRSSFAVSRTNIPPADPRRGALRTMGGVITPKPRVVRSRAGIARALEARRVPILAPFRWLRAADPLPHSWHVTSDSIAAWVAGRLGAWRLILLKSVDGVCDDSHTLLSALPRTAIEGAPGRGSSILDRYFARALAASTECWIINGRGPERLRALVETQTTTGTIVC